MARLATFIAINIPLEAKEKIRTLIEQLKKKNYPCLWADPQQAHITLAFLGRISQERVESAAKAADTTAEGLGPFELKTNSINYFHREKRTRYQTIFIDVSDPERKLRELYKKLSKNMAEEGFSPAKRLHPHITIGRLKKLKSKQEAQSILAKVVNEDESVYNPFLVDSISIYKSVYQEPLGSSTNQTKTRHHLIKNIPLGTKTSEK